MRTISFALPEKQQKNKKSHTNSSHFILQGNFFEKNSTRGDPDSAQYSHLWGGGGL